MVSINYGEVLIFKALSDDGEDDDPYRKKLQECGLITKLIPVLDFEYCNLELLHSYLQTPINFSGIIFTSPRAVKAVALSLGTKSGLHTEWQERPAFVVGEGTQRALERELAVKGEGSHSGSAGDLADYILERTYEQPLLFPCGNLKHDVLPNKLAKGGVRLSMVTVYQTKPWAHLEENLTEATTRGTQVPEFLVYFSPSGVKSTVPVFEKLQIPLKQVKIVAIGPTTEGALKELQLPVWSRASKPNPDSLAVSIVGRE
ncbi:uroporphyrinogen-III synthase [Anabrus simplex]|uniref:uroporphyrinogen-III synthase n=1 Tax=Anabrus simplex TaxID=316456 RepID=UPI0035A3948A